MDHRRFGASACDEYLATDSYFDACDVRRGVDIVNSFHYKAEMQNRTVSELEQRVGDLSADLSYLQCGGRCRSNSGVAHVQCSDDRWGEQTKF